MIARECKGMKTIRKIADEIGASKQAVFKNIKREPPDLNSTLFGKMIRG